MGLKNIKSIFFFFFFGGGSLLRPLWIRHSDFLIFLFFSEAEFVCLVVENINERDIS